MKRIHIHWTAGDYSPNAIDLKHYHFVTDDRGNHHTGVPVERNEGSLKSGYAAHTLNANTDAIGTSMACMGGAQESPFDPGEWPMLERQFEAHMELVAKLARRYGIPVTRETVLTHAEVQPNLGIRQRGKWDITRLPFRPELVGFRAVGDHIRDRVSHYLNSDSKEGTMTRAVPAGAIGKVFTNGSDLNMRSGPFIGGRDIGNIPDGTPVEILADMGDWLMVRTPGGYDGYVSSDFIVITDEPIATKPTTPDPKRIAIEAIRDELDKLEALL